MSQFRPVTSAADLTAPLTARGPAATRRRNPVSQGLSDEPPATSADPRQVRTLEGITEYELGNGLRVLLFPDATQSTVTVNVTYLVGSMHEGAGETGMAHLLAVSGAHVSLLLGLVGFVLRALALRVRRLAEEGAAPRLAAALPLRHDGRCPRRERGRVDLAPPRAELRDEAGVADGYAQLNPDALVLQDPASASATPTETAAPTVEGPRPGLRPRSW